MWHGNIHNAHPLHRWLVIIEAAQVITRHESVAFGIPLAPRLQHRANIRAALLEASGKDLEFEILFVPASRQIDLQLGRFGPPTCRQLQAQRPRRCAGQIATQTDLDCRCRPAPHGDYLRPRFQRNRECRRECQGSLSLLSLFIQKMYCHICVDVRLNLRLGVLALSKFPVKVRDGRMNPFSPRNFVFRMHVHQRRREGKSQILLVIDSINCFSVGIIAMPVRSSEGSILWDLNSKVGVVILSWADSD